jgi:hypothetical protein
MGGIGSGNRHHVHRPPARLCVEDVLTLSSAILRADAESRSGRRWVCRDGRMVEVSWRIEWWSRRLVLTTSWDGCSRAVDIEAVEQPRRGGWQWLFVCPDCSRRCRTLHCPPDMPPFGCRLCSKLTYRCSQECDRHRSLYKHLAQRLSCKAETVEGFIREAGRNEEPMPFHPRPLVPTGDRP